MTISEAQLEIRTRFVGGFYGQLVSGTLWLTSASLAVWRSTRAQMPPAAAKRDQRLAGLLCSSLVASVDGYDALFSTKDSWLVNLSSGDGR